MPSFLAPLLLVLMLSRSFAPSLDAEGDPEISDHVLRLI